LCLTFPLPILKLRKKEERREGEDTKERQPQIGDLKLPGHPCTPEKNLNDGAFLTKAVLLI
jgi:hypothetical protein